MRHARSEYTSFESSRRATIQRQLRLHNAALREEKAPFLREIRKLNWRIKNEKSAGFRRHESGKSSAFIAE